MANYPIKIDDTTEQVDVYGNMVTGPFSGGGGGTIQGKMLTVSREMGMLPLTRIGDQPTLEIKIKEELARDLALGMLKSGMIEFTKQTDPSTFNITYRARCFMTPSEQVQILRKIGYK